METICNDFLFSLITSRSGILVLINDVDWEVLDKEKTVLEVCSFCCRCFMSLGRR